MRRDGDSRWRLTSSRARRWKEGAAALKKGRCGTKIVARQASPGTSEHGRVQLKARSDRSGSDQALGDGAEVDLRNFWPACESATWKLLVFSSFLPVFLTSLRLSSASTTFWSGFFSAR